MDKRKTGSLSLLQWGASQMALLFLSLTMILSAGFSLQQEILPPVGEYRIGPNDLLEIKVFELPELSQTVRVSQEGSITLSLLGKVDAAQLTAQELEKKLASILEKQWLKTAHVTVFVREFQKVAILGAISRPGLYELAGQTTLLQIIAQAGGLTGEAMNEITIHRSEKDNKKTKITIDLNELIRQGNQGLNLILQPRDEIIVPIDSLMTIYVYGEVKNPGRLQPRMSAKITLLQAIAQAGGTTEWASRSKVQINRKDAKTGKEQKIIVNLKNIINGKTRDIELREGDVVIVP